MKLTQKDKITDMARDLFVAQAEEIIASDAPEASKGARMQAAVTGSINIARHFFSEADRLLGGEGGDGEEATPAGVASTKKKSS